uniref:Uncharacterized protein n=1 Tax=Coccolithus braarudii TaxID=221442 RepID=A0A7S0L2H7_9EUKA|mmetsp:Transcript_15607/g.33865  ORF Transcript_15607/g.33865 Transcript_15607/m.33865 type:complete len:258 (+) Transcript_15607:47-820(+)
MARGAGSAKAGLFVCSTAMLALCFLLLPAFYLPDSMETTGRSTVNILRQQINLKKLRERLNLKKLREQVNFKQLQEHLSLKQLRDRLSTKKLGDLSSKQLRKLKKLFIKKKRKLSETNASDTSVVEAIEPSVETEEPSDDPEELARIFSILGSSAKEEAQERGLMARPPPPAPRRAHHEFDRELLGDSPQSMFDLLHVSHSVCQGTGMDNRTLARTLASCSSRCLLANLEPGSGRTCSHFAWLAVSRQCFIYPECAC